jgi:hypothetical protein
VDLKIDPFLWRQVFAAVGLRQPSDTFLEHMDYEQSHRGEYVSPYLIATAIVRFGVEGPFNETQPQPQQRDKQAVPPIA